MINDNSRNRELAKAEQIMTQIVISNETAWTRFPGEGDLFAVMYHNAKRQVMTWLASRTVKNPASAIDRFEIVGSGSTIDSMGALAWKAAPKEMIGGRDFPENDSLWFSQLLQDRRVFDNDGWELLQSNSNGWEKNCLANAILNERTRWQFHPEDKPRGSAAIAYYGPLLRLGLGEYNGRWFLYNGTNESIVLDDRDVFAWKKVLG